jgi:hypothetical protein
VCRGLAADWSRLDGLVKRLEEGLTKLCQAYGERCGTPPPECNQVENEQSAQQSHTTFTTRSVRLPIATKLQSSNTSLGVCAVASISPEDKYGPTGYDPEGTPPESRKRFVSGDRPFTYKIDFWNKEDAPAPTQDVYITDDLDPNLDWNSFSFTEFGFLKWKVPLEGGQYFNVEVDLRPDMDLVVNVEGTFDPATGKIRWEFHSLDPITREPPEDPMAGFLPPITDTGYEIGWVTYSVNPKAGLPTGTEIRNQAWVKFDVDVFKPAPPNPDSEIPGYGPYRNTIDSGAPTSRVTPLSTLQTSKHFMVSWEGEDDEGGSGIKEYDVYVSDNGGPYVLWLTTSETSSTFSGEFGHQYSFYSRARDHVGNLEDAPSPLVPDATTMVGVADISVTPLSFDFGHVKVGVLSEKVFVVKNEGSAELTLGVIGSPSAPFSRVGGTCAEGSILVPSSTCTVIIGFSPSSTGGFSSSFEITSDDLDENRVRVGLIGKGVVHFLVEPAHGTLGTEVEIRGSGFGGKKGKVLVGSVALKVTGWTDSSIHGVVSRPQPPGKYSVTVQPKGGSSLTEPEAFEIRAPEIVSVNPTEGSTGDEIRIEGNFFGSKKGKVYLEKGGFAKSCKVMGWGLTEVRFQVPKGLSAGPYTLILENKISRAEASFTVK